MNQPSNNFRDCSQFSVEFGWESNSRYSVPGTQIASSFPSLAPRASLSSYFASFGIFHKTGLSFTPDEHSLRLDNKYKLFE